MGVDEADAATRRLTGLRRAAYSRATTPAERENAVEAQRELAELEQGARTDEAAPDPDPDPASPAEPDASQHTVETPETEAAPSPRRRILVIAIALAIGLGVGFGGGVLSAVASQSAAEREAVAGDPTSEAAQQALSDQLVANLRASEIPYVAAGKTAQIYGPGDSEAAERWFAEPQRPEDIPETLPIDVADPSTLRLVYDNAEWGRVWVVKGTDGSLCLYTLDASATGGGLACTDRASFDANGLGWQITKAGGSSSITLRWDGWDLLVAMNSY